MDRVNVGMDNVNIDTAGLTKSGDQSGISRYCAGLRPNCALN